MERQAEQHEAVQIARTLETAHDADVAEALNAIDHAAAARVLAALPFDLAVRAVNQPELDHRAHLFEHLPTDKAVALMTAMSADQRVEVFRGLSDRARARLMPTIDEPTRASLRSLLSYAPTTSGGIMTRCTKASDRPPALLAGFDLDVDIGESRAPQPIRQLRRLHGVAGIAEVRDPEEESTAPRRCPRTSRPASARGTPRRTSGPAATASERGAAS